MALRGPGEPVKARPNRGFTQVLVQEGNRWTARRQETVQSITLPFPAAL